MRNGCYTYVYSSSILLSITRDKNRSPFEIAMHDLTFILRGRLWAIYERVVSPSGP